MLVVSAHADAHYVRAALAAGAFGYLAKEHLARELLPAVQRVAAGERFVSPQLAAARGG